MAEQARGQAARQGRLGVKRKHIERTREFERDLEAIEAYVAQENPRAALDLWLLIDSQAEKLADPNFPRRRGKIAGTKELVAHENYVVILKEDEDTVTLLNVVHARRRWP